MREITGVWKLVRTSSSGEDGSEMPAPYGGSDAVGLLSLGVGGRMAAVLYNGGDVMPAGAVREYNSYCGAYTYDGKKLSTRVDGSSNPAWADTDQVRDVSFEGELMVLRPPFRAYAGQAEQRVLYWKKISDS